MSAKQKSLFNHLTKAPSKEVVVKMCHQAILYKDLGPDQIPDTVIADWSSTLKITKGETKQLVVALSQLLKQAVFLYSSEPDQAAQAFPDDFHKDLQSLLMSIISKHFASWKSELAESNSTFPKLIEVSCRVDSTALESQPLDVIPTTQANCVLQLKIDDSSLTGTQGIQTVDVKLTKEKLNAMLDGLGKIRDQLTSVSQR